MLTDQGRHRRGDPSGPSGLSHVALLHDGDAGFVDAAVAHARAGFDRDEPVIAALHPRQLRTLHEALGPQSELVDYRDMTEIGRNPGRLIPELHGVLMQYHGRGRLNVISGSIWSERSAGERAAAVETEALVNLAAADAPVSLLCPYDTSTLDHATLDLAVATHPEDLHGGRVAPSATYDPRATARSAIGPYSALRAVVSALRLRSVPSTSRSHP